MPEHFRALIVVLGVAIPAFWVARRAVAGRLMGREDFNRRCKLWFAVTLLAFLSHDFWLYTIFASLVLLMAGKKEHNPAALYALLVVAVPGFEQPIPGMGLVEHIFAINHVRMLHLAILLPAALRLARQPTDPASGPWRICDGLLLTYLLYSFVHRSMFDSVTGTMRFGFYLWLDIWLPYFVVTRTVRSVAALKECMAALTLAVSITAVLAVFEMTRHWLLYESLRQALGLPISLPMYLTRGEGGALRANVTSLNAIALGYTMMIALIFSMGLARQLAARWQALFSMLVLAAGLFAALSRGPWVGAAAGIVTAMALGPGGLKRLVALVVLGAMGFGVLLLTPYADDFIDLLPFVGTVEPGSVEYRQRLFDVSMIVFWESPIFGVPDFLLHPAMQVMRQGQGIIDIVNTYIGVALSSGAVGLGLFVAPFLWIGLLLWRSLRKPACRDEELQPLGRSLLGALVGVAVTIATVSSITVIPVFYWMLLALCVTFVRQADAASVKDKSHAAVRAATYGARHDNPYLGALSQQSPP